MVFRRILVTGAAGFIGANFSHHWLAHYPADQLVLLDALTYAGNRHNLSAIIEAPNLRFVRGNICDHALVEELLKDHAIDTIVNFAAESHVDRSITNPDAFIESNIIGTYTLLKVAKSLWLDAKDAPASHRFHHISTDETYGNLASSDPAFCEDSAYAPNSPYAASKASADHLVRAYHHTYGLQVTTSNCSNNYGPYHFPEKLIPLVITNILTDQSLPIYGDGQQIRDWLYVEDHVRGIELVLNKGRVGESYNIGGNNEWANIDIVRLICSEINQVFASHPVLRERYPQATCAIAGKSEDLISHVADRPGHDRRYAINAQKIESQLGFRPQQTFASGIRKTIHWYLDNPDWWRAILDGSYQHHPS